MRRFERPFPLKKGGAILLASLMTLALAAPAAAVTQWTVAVCATDSTGANIVLGADQAWLATGSNHYVGPVGDTGCRQELVNNGTTVEVWVAKNGTSSQHKTATITGDKTFNFYTTKVTLQYSGGQNLAFGGPTGDSAWFSKPSMELFSDGVTPVNFRLGGTGGANGRLSLVWPIATDTGFNFKRSLIALRLIDSNGDPLNGGTARYQTNYWSYAPGETGAGVIAPDPGILAYALPGLVGNVTNEMKYNNTIQTVTQNAATDSVYQFRTREASLRLLDRDDNPLQGGKPRYGRNNTYTTWWWPGGLTNTNGNSKAEIFPGTYSFEMTYQGTAEAMVGETMPNADHTFTWHTATVTLSWPNKISYGGGAGDGRWFDKPSMDLLAGTYKFHFRDPSGCTEDLTWASGDDYSDTGCD